jgi:hypothetical protein
MRLGTWHRRLLLAVLALVASSGVLWFVLHDVVEREADDLLRMLLAAHGWAAYASAVGFGSVLPLHVLAGYRLGRNRKSGLLLVLIMTLLIVSALGLYYGSEETRAWARVVHLVVGFASLAVVPLHILFGRRATACRQTAGTRS